MTEIRGSIQIQPSVLVLYEIFAVFPQAFEVVKIPLFVVEHVHDYVLIVEYRPSAAPCALYALGLESVLLGKFLLEIFRKRFDLRSRTSAAYYKIVAQRSLAFNVDIDEIGSLFFAVYARNLERFSNAEIF